MPLTPKQQPPYYDTTNTVKIYKALLSQEGTNAPTAAIITNTTGQTLTWARDGDGLYTLTSPIAIFPKYKTIIYGLQTTGGSKIVAVNNEIGEPSTQIALNSYANNTLFDDILYLTSIIIEIHP